MLHDLDMGYYTLEDRTPFSSIEWFEEENNYTHEFALEESARLYAFNKLQDYLPLELYLNLPTIVCDDIITGLVKGRAERHKFEEEQRKANAPKENNGGVLNDAEKLAALEARLDKLNNN